MTRAWHVFYSYSHKDHDIRDRLATYLAPMRHNGKLLDWHDREIVPGTDWQKEISDKLQTADLIIFLVSPDFLSSEYCLGVEVTAALKRVPLSTARVLPILVRECLWEESVFSEMQMIPRDAKPIMSSLSVDAAFTNVAKEVRSIVELPIPTAVTSSARPSIPALSSNDLVRQQTYSYARLYERTRARMPASNERTLAMEEIASKMRAISLVAYPLLDELVGSPLPGERLAAIVILQVLSAEQYLDFLSKLVGSEKPFIGYHAIRALRFAVDALEPSAYHSLNRALIEADNQLQRAAVGLDTDRRKLLDEARNALRVRDTASKFGS